MSESNIHYLSHVDFEIICTELTKFFSKVNDPAPDYKHSQFEKLDSILSIPQKTFDGKDLYGTIYEKAACYLYFINKLHPFSNGNKRISIVASAVFLKLNKVDLLVDHDSMYRFAKEVTQSHSDQKVEFKKVVEFITAHCVTAPKS